MEISEYWKGYGQFVEEVAKELCLEPDNEGVLRRIHALMNLAVKVADAYDSKPDYWCSCGQCEDFKEHAQDVLNSDYWRTE